MKYFICPRIILIGYLIITKTLSLHINNTTETVNEKGIHLKYEYVKKVCSKRLQICKSDDSAVCAIRIIGGIEEFKDFENSCFLFLNNLCNDFENEYSIISSGTCNEYFKSRRLNPTPNVTSKPTTHKYATTKKAVRSGASNFSLLYDFPDAFDGDICPLSCTPDYKPVCLNVNRGNGMYFKLYTFVNHCTGDLYYCRNWREFSPPPGEVENIKSSHLTWSYCATNRFTQFARFTELASSMGHYGWLAGDFRFISFQYNLALDCDLTCVTIQSVMVAVNSNIAAPRKKARVWIRCKII